MMDEAQRLGIQINPARLEKELGITVVTMAAAQNVGISVLKERVFEYVKSDCLSAAY
ncbi:FeoB small GTPase domain-containing protein [Aerosakkonema sp. BLCC-F183]